MLRPDDRGPQPRTRCRALAWRCGITLAALGTVAIVLAPQVGWAGSDGVPRKIGSRHFASVQQALRVGVENLNAGRIEAALTALTYAAVNGQLIARWKLGELYAIGDGVPRDDLKAYSYFNQIVEGYDEDRPDRQDLRAISDAFVAVGVYCLSGVPDSNIVADPWRAHELFQYAATIFDDPNAQYNLAHMYIVGTGGVAKDHIAAIRWLALAAKQGHRPSQALLGHMLFVGDSVPDHRAEGLMWLELAQDGAPNPQDQWIHDLYQRDFRAADDNIRQTAAMMRQTRAKGAKPQLADGSSAASFLESFDAPPGVQ